MDQKLKAVFACIMMSSFAGCTETSSDNNAQNNTESENTESPNVTFKFDKDYVVTGEAFEVSGLDSSGTCFWFIEESPEKSNATIIKKSSNSNNICKAEVKTDLAGKYVITLLGLKGSQQTRISQTINSGTLLDSVITENKALTLQESPYIIRSAHDFAQDHTSPEVATDVIVTIEAGVSIINDKHTEFDSRWPAVWINRGQIIAEGTDENWVKIEGIQIKNYEIEADTDTDTDTKEKYSLELSFTEYSAQKLEGKIKIQYSKLFIDGEDGLTLLDKSIIQQAEITASNNSSSGNIKITNEEVDFQFNTVTTDLFIINGNKSNTIENNNFTSVDLIMGEIINSGINVSSNYVDIKNNYWSTTETNEIRARIDDQINNPDSNYLFNIEPVLSENPALSP